jgi:type IV fimbrial biogenesis protein FimT
MIRQPAGYSYLQILLVVALLAILAAVASPYYVQWQQQQRVDSTALLLIADLQNTQTRALQRYYNDTWGVHIADSAKVYTVFHGTSYNSTDSYNYMVSYPSSVSVSPDQDIVFESGSGELDSGTTTITVTSTTLPTEAVTININEQGLID